MPCLPPTFLKYFRNNPLNNRNFYYPSNRFKKTAMIKRYLFLSDANDLTSLIITNNSYVCRKPGGNYSKRSIFTSQSSPSLKRNLISPLSTCDWNSFLKSLGTVMSFNNLLKSFLVSHFLV